MLGMHNSTFLFIVLLIIQFLLLTDCYSDNVAQSKDNIDISAPRPGWIDPFDMLGETGHYHDSLIVQSDVELSMLKKRCEKSDLYLRRIVNLFLRAVELKDDNTATGSMNFVQLQFEISGKDLDVLRQYGESENTAASVESVSQVFTHIFSQKRPQEQNNFSFGFLFKWVQKAIFKILSSPEWTVVFSVSLMLFMTLWFVYKTHSYRLALFTLFLTIFFAGYGFTWIRMYEEKEVERYVNIVMHGDVPYHCSSKAQHMRWYEHMYYRMFGVDCLKFYQARDVRPLAKISPTDVLAETISSMFVNPSQNIGKAYGNFIKSTVGYLPWWLKPIAVPLSFIVPIVFVILLLALLFNYQLSISWTGFHLMPNWSHSPQVLHRQDSQYIEDMSHRRVEKENLQKSSDFNTMLLESKTPVFVVMNWLGLKKLSSENLFAHKDKNDESNISTSVDDQNVDSTGREDNGGTTETKDVKKISTSVEKPKAIQDCKRRPRSIYTSVRENDTANSSNDDNSAVEEGSDLGSGDQRQESSGVSDMVKSNQSKDKIS